MNRPAKVALYLLYLGVVVSICVEAFVRLYLIPYQNLGYIEITGNEFPFFRLVEHYAEHGVTIQKRRRELAPRGMREFSLAFVGDSVTFGTHVDDKDSYVEQVQTSQDLFDAYNYGVPGYGIMEIAEVVKGLVDEAEHELIIYTFNFNDIHTGMGGYLPLMTNAQTRFASIDKYDGVSGSLKQLGKDYFKSLLVIKFALTSLRSSFSTESKQTLESSDASSPTALCEDEIAQMATSETYQRENRLWKLMYHDAGLMRRLAERLEELRQRTEAAGVTLIVVPSYPYLMFAEGVDESYRQVITDVFNRSGLTFIDSHPLYLESYDRCDFYVDPRHLGPLGSKRKAELLIRSIRNRLSSAAANDRETS